MSQMQLSVTESLMVSSEQSYWDGYVAGVAAAADHAKRLGLQKLLSSKSPQPEAPNPDLAPIPAL